MRRSLLAIAVGLSLAAWAGTAHGDELVLPAGSQCKVAKQGEPDELDRVVDFDASHFVLNRASAAECRVCSLDLADERAEHRRTVDAVLRLAAPEPGWRIAVRWAVIGVTISAAFAAGAVLF